MLPVPRGARFLHLGWLAPQLQEMKVEWYGVWGKGCRDFRKLGHGEAGLV